MTTLQIYLQHQCLTVILALSNLIHLQPQHLITTAQNCIELSFLLYTVKPELSPLIVLLVFIGKTPPMTTPCTITGDGDIMPRRHPHLYLYQHHYRTLVWTSEVMGSYTRNLCEIMSFIHADLTFN